MADDNPTKIPEMVERAARAMCKALGVEPDALVHQNVEPINRLGFWYATHPDNVFPMWQWLTAAVRAAIWEMREPTEAMLAEDAQTEWDYPAGGPRHMKALYTAMIDAALGE